MLENVGRLEIIALVVTEFLRLIELRHETRRCTAQHTRCTTGAHSATLVFTQFSYPQYKQNFVVVYKLVTVVYGHQSGSDFVVG